MNVADCRSYIDGRFVPSTSGVVLDNLNPATGERIGGIELALEAEVEQAVSAASRGFAVWSAMTGTERGRILNRAAALLPGAGAARGNRHRKADPGGRSRRYPERGRLHRVLRRPGGDPARHPP
jgi:hypothetical protein